MAKPHLLTVNELLLEEITKVNYTLIPHDFNNGNFMCATAKLVQESMSALVDELGQQSAAAQDLSTVITSAARMKNAPDSALYLLKDSVANYGNGEVIGMLKMAHKHLYLFDERDQCREVEPLCVLDFFVRPEYQRLGHGRRLFNYMLQDTGAMPTQLAVDGPSPKIEQFLVRHYGVERLIRQSNNFAVAPQFFGANDQQGELPPNADAMRRVGRYAAQQRNSSIAEVIHGSNRAQHISADWAENRERAAAEIKRVRSPLPTPATVETVNGEHASLPSRPVELPIPAVENDGAAAGPSATMPRSPHSDQYHAITTKRSPRRGADEDIPHDPQVTEKGYFDVKYYHSKLW